MCKQAWPQDVCSGRGVCLNNTVCSCEAGWQSCGDVICHTQDCANNDSAIAALWIFYVVLTGIFFVGTTARLALMIHRDRALKRMNEDDETQDSRTTVPLATPKRKQLVGARSAFAASSGDDNSGGGGGAGGSAQRGSNPSGSGGGGGAKSHLGLQPQQRAVVSSWEPTCFGVPFTFGVSYLSMSAVYFGNQFAFGLVKVSTNLIVGR